MNRVYKFTSHVSVGAQKHSQQDSTGMGIDEQDQDVPRGGLLSNSDGTSEQTTDDSNLQGPRESTHTSPMGTDRADTPPHDTRDKESSTSRESAPEGLSEEHSLDVPEIFLCT